MTILMASVLLNSFQFYLVLLLVIRFGNSGVSLIITVFTELPSFFWAYIIERNYFSMIEGVCVVSFKQG